YLVRWSTRAGIAPLEMAKGMIEADSAWTSDMPDFLFSMLGQDDKKASWKSFIDGKTFSSEGNLYLRWLDTCQTLAGMNDLPELMKSRYRTVEVLLLNLNRMKSGLISQLESLQVPESTINSVAQSFEKLMEVPVKPALWTYQRMVDQTAKLLSKKVELIVKGDDITLPRDVLYSVQDALVHLIRNTIDHGIENPEVREKANKPATGRLTIECALTKQSTIIKIQDDGAGIDQNRIAKIAVEKGLIEEADVKKLSVAQKLEMIFMAGFSSKQNVTEFSGRGIGLDVVKNNIESLGGKVLVSSQTGIGTTFEIRIPNESIG
ncbi:MAG: ATP-binding protein, partial [Bdellovibrionia bacterium]